MTILDRLHAPRPACLSMLLALLLIAPVTLAHASPPDQTWLAGVYDHADFDDVVGLLTSALEASGIHQRARGRCLSCPRAEAVPGHGAMLGTTRWLRGSE